MSVNDINYDRAVRHLSALQRVYTQLDKRVQRDLNAHRGNVAAILTAVGSNESKLAKLERETVRAYRNLEGRVMKSILGVGDNEVRFQTNNLNRTLSTLRTAKSPSRRDLARALEQQPISSQRTQISSRRTLGQWMTGIQRTEHDKLSQLVRTGFAQGLEPSAIVSQLDQVGSPLIRSKADARALVRTTFTHTQNLASSMVYTANADVLDGYQWISTLDGRTSTICSSRDGRVFPLDSGILPPAHFNCRSSTVPIVKSLEALPVPQTRKDALSPASRASFNGKVPATEDYSTWLYRQPAGIQDEILGSDKAQVFRAGNLSIRKFYDIDGLGISLDQLRRLDDRTLGDYIPQTPFTPGQDVRRFDLTANVTSIDQLISMREELVTLIAAQANIRNTSFSSINQTPGYKEYLRNGAKGLYVNRRYDSILGEIVDFKYLPLDSDTYLNELRLLSEARTNGTISRKQYNFINNILSDLTIAVEGNQRLAVIRTLRLAFSRQDFDPNIADINRYLTEQLNSHSRQLTRSVLERSANIERARRGVDKTPKEIRSDSNARNKDITSLNAQFDTLGRRNSFLLEGELPNDLSTLATQDVISTSLRFVAGRLGTDATQLSVQLGRRLYTEAGITVSAQRASNLGTTVLNVLDSEGLIDFVRVRRAPGRDKSISKADDQLSVTQDVDVIAVDSSNVLLRRYKDNINEQRVNGNLPVTPGKVDRPLVGDTDHTTQDFVNYSPDRALDAIQVETLNAANQTVLRIEPRMIAAYRGLLDEGDPHLTRLNDKRGGNIVRIIETSEVNGDVPIANNHQFDARGRTYSESSYLDYQGAGDHKAVINFNNKETYGDNGFDHVLNYAGDILGADNTLEARNLLGRQYRDRMVQMGQLIHEERWGELSAYQSRVFTFVSKDDREILMRLSLEFYDVERWVNPSRFGLGSQPRNIVNFRSSLSVPNDATASAVQHAAGLTRSARLGELSNVSPTTKANRPYTVVGKYAQDRVSLPGIANKFEDPRSVEVIKSLSEAQYTKIAKHPSMTTLYGAHSTTKVQQVRKAMMTIFEDDPELRNILPDMSDNDVVQFARLITEGIDVEIPELSALYRFLNDTFGRVNAEISYPNPSGTTIINRYNRQVNSTITQSFGGVNTTSRYVDVLDEIDSKAQASAGPANYIHSLDGDHIATVNRITAREDIDFLGIHDSFGTHAGSVDRLGIITRQAYADIYNQNVLLDLIEHLRESNQLTTADANDLLMILRQGIDVGGRRIVLDPTQGDLIINSVLDSVYSTS